MSIRLIKFGFSVKYVQQMLLCGEGHFSIHLENVRGEIMDWVELLSPGLQGACGFHVKASAFTYSFILDTLFLLLCVCYFIALGK